MSALTVTRRQLTRYLTRLHFEAVSPEGSMVDQVCAHVRARQAVQFDPIDVVGRNADLVLQSRIDGYRPEGLRRAIYEERRLYDGYDKNLCVYPVEDFPCFGRMRREMAIWFRENEDVRAYLPRALEEIDRRGALCSEDLEWDEKVRWPWGRTRVSRAALESLWMEGILAIARREGTRKYYDRFERCYGGAWREQPDPHPEDADYFAWQALRRTRSVGFLTGGASDAFLCVTGMKQAERRAAFERLLAEGRLIEVDAEGLRGYIPAENEALLGSRAELRPRMRFIAPLDNLIWDRKLVERLFGFAYRWEIYVPAEQRKYGYYVLPVMFEDAFVARFEAEKFDGTTLRIRNWWWEEGWSKERLPKTAMEDALARFAGFLNAQGIECAKDG